MGVIDQSRLDTQMLEPQRGEIFQPGVKPSLFYTS